MIRTFRAGAATAALAFLALTGCGSGGGSDTPATERSTTLGPVAGNDDTSASGTYSWKGIPFAKPPTGELRWKAPADPAAWTSPRNTREFASACVQSGRLYGPGFNNRYDATIGTALAQTVGSEDCLYLNVWQPSAASATPRPVVVFVHGGSNITGYTADPVYDGAALAKNGDVVVVTVNYRLGIFGFLNQGALKTGTAEDNSGNFAILDLIKALKFVQANIASFGGDPKNVTLMGESAGAVNIYALMTSPLVVNASQPLFHRVAPMSGGISLASNLPAGSIPVLVPEATWKAQGDALLAQSLIADGTVADATAAQAYIAGRTPAQIADYLRAKSPDALLSVVRSRLAAAGLSGANPIPEGTVVPVDPIAAIKAGRYTKVPVLASNTRDEGKLFPSFLALAPALGGINGRLIDDATVFNITFNYKPEAAPTTTVEQWIPAAYLPVDAPTTGFTARSELLNSVFFLVGRDDVLNAMKTQQSNIWYYRFDWDEEPAPFNQIYGAAHGFELPFAFGNFGPSLYANIAYTNANRPGRLALSEAMMKTIGAFAQKGDPNSTAIGVPWPTWPGKLVFDATLTANTITAQ